MDKDNRYRRSMNLFITRTGTKKVPAGDTCRFWRTGAITGCVFGGPGKAKKNGPHKSTVRGSTE